MTAEVTIIIPTIAVRPNLLLRAIDSVSSQTIDVECIVEPDLYRNGAAVTRQRALEKVQTEFYLPLDDDDELYPDAVEKLLNTLRETDADYVYPHYTVVGGTDPRPENLGKEFDPNNPVQTTIVALARASVSIELGGYVDETEDADLGSPDRHYAGEDWRLTKRYLEANKKIVHHPEPLFYWHHWWDGKNGNTSGLAKNW